MAKETEVVIAFGNASWKQGKGYASSPRRLRFAKYFEQFHHHQRRPPDQSVSKIHVCSVNEFNTSQSIANSTPVLSFTHFPRPKFPPYTLHQTLPAQAMKPALLSLVVLSLLATLCAAVPVPIPPPLSGDSSNITPLSPDDIAILNESGVDTVFKDSN
ncbi:uncharacterized protein BJ171DRAFT_580523 [Polychytrium aggregatum]|uniref:uncharacterized protein n=1 Tax=Polychytrium aggregatum TaxID=110093 RepID=UPI0022FED812|nr:uncharacterized protein BJ171DRAFT_580523 [Polychytrium aggregatum]KAI9205873.1 hypothetical protein BJ171DRAFT_580523 [Polychytrium aggregatum]